MFGAIAGSKNTGLLLMLFHGLLSESREAFSDMEPGGMQNTIHDDLIPSHE